MALSRLLLLTILLAALPNSSAAQDPGGVHWPSFRGPAASGVADGHPLPERWDAKTGSNVRWSTPIPGLGHSSPVIWSNRIFLTSAISGKPDAELRVGLYGDIAPVEDSTNHRFVVYCLDKRSGKILWERVAFEGVPKIKRHTKATHANSTPATDGKHVVALFGSEGLHAYDFDGKLLWKKDLGVLDSGFYRVPEAQWGFGSSPVIHDGRVIVQADVQGDSFLAAFDVVTGKQIWRTAREEVPTWSTPTIYRAGGTTRIAVNGYRRIGGYDFATGEPLWWMRGGGDIPVPTPVVADGLIFITNAHGNASPILAVRETASGDVSLGGEQRSNAAIAWSIARGGAYMQTPLAYRDLLYVCRDNGVLSCYDRTTGKRLYQTRLGTGGQGFTASAVAGDGKLYFSGEEGDIFVLAAGREPRELAVNAMHEVTMATPALSEGVLYVRTRDHLVAIAAPAPPTAPPPAGS